MQRVLCLVLVPSEATKYCSDIVLLNCLIFLVMERINGDANINAVKEAKNAGILVL